MWSFARRGRQVNVQVDGQRIFNTAPPQVDAALADAAVTIVSSTTPERSALADEFERHFATRTRAVVGVPYDPALEVGSSIDHPTLLPETRRAWLRAAATIIQPFAG